MTLPKIASRVQSPSSINCYKQCPRKYYYSYIEKIRKAPNIHQYRGNIVHSALEKFFDINLEDLQKMNDKEIEEIKGFLHSHLILLFDKEWDAKKREIDTLGFERPQIEFFNDESKMMLEIWLRDFINKISIEMKEHTFSKSFLLLKPLRETKLESKRYNVLGYIDAILTKDNKVTLIDYKTSKEKHISEEIRLQLAIYALLFFETYGRLPHKTSAFFLKHGEVDLEVDEDLLQLARLECELIKTNTESTNKADYPRKESGLCRWSTGQCDFYDLCVKD